MSLYHSISITIVASVILITESQGRTNECTSTDDVDWNISFNDEDSDLSTDKYCYNICLYAPTQCDFSKFLRSFDLLVPNCCNEHENISIISDKTCGATTTESCRKNTKYTTSETGWKWSNFQINSNNDEGCCQFCIDYSNINEYNIIPYINGSYIATDKFGNRYSDNTIVPDICGCTQPNELITGEPTSTSNTPCPTINPQKSENARIAKESIITGIMQNEVDINTEKIDNYISYLLNDDFNDKLLQYDVNNIQYMTQKYLAYITSDELIKSRNSMHLSYKLQHTFMSDLLDYEIEDYLGGDLEIITRDNTQTSQQSIGVCYGKDSIQFNGNPPSTWRNAPVHDIRSQGSCGSCWNFASVAAVEVSVHENSGAVYDLSEQMVLDCIDHCDGDSFIDTCSGGSASNALAYIRDNNGLCVESDYQYSYVAAIKPCRSDNCNKLTCTAPDAIYCLPNGNSNSINYESDINEIIRNIKSAVLLGGVVIAFDFLPTLGLYTNDNSDDAPQIFQCYEEDVNITSGGHVMTIVGYTVDYWIIRNSWGVKPNNEGYVYWKIKDSLDKDYCNLYSRGGPRFPYFNVKQKKCQIDNIGAILSGDIDGVGSVDYSNLALNVNPNFKCRVFLYEHSSYSNYGDIYGWYYIGQYTWTDSARITIKSISISSNTPANNNGGNIGNFINPSVYCRVFLYEFSDYSGESISFTGPAAIPSLISKGFSQFTVGAMIVS
eukprot:524821_1